MDEMEEGDESCMGYGWMRNPSFKRVSSQRRRSRFDSRGDALVGCPGWSLLELRTH